MNNESSHLDFPNKTQVINIRPTSRFFGKRGVVYGSGPSKNAPDNQAALIYVCWDNGERASYFPNRLSVAPKNEREYVVHSTSEGKKKTTIREVKSNKRAHLSLVELNQIK